MSETDRALDELPAMIAAAIDAGIDRVPFGRWLGMKLVSIEGDRVEMGFAMRDELVGNPQKGSLHGGIVAAALDTVGGFAALVGVLSRSTRKSEDPPSPWLSTIDMRTDFLRPGLGEEFTASAFTLRVGGRSVVTRMELHSDKGELVAVGIGTYAVP